MSSGRPDLRSGYRPFEHPIKMAHCCPNCGITLAKGYSCGSCADNLGKYYLSVERPLEVDLTPSK